MAVALESWLNLIDKEYLRDFIANGGSAVKFVESEPERLEEIQSRIIALAEGHGLATCRIDAARSKLHMIQDVFFAISRSLDWTAMAQGFVEALVAKNGYEWPRPGHAVTFQDVAAFNRIAVPLLKRDLNHWLTDDIWHDRAMTQDFRAAMTQLCLTRLESPETDSDRHRAGGRMAAGRAQGHRRGPPGQHHRQDHPSQRSRHASVALPVAAALRAQRALPRRSTFARSFAPASRSARASAIPRRR